MGYRVCIGNSPSLTLNYPAVVNPALNSAFHHLPNISWSLIFCKEKKMLMSQSYAKRMKI